MRKSITTTDDNCKQTAKKNHKNKKEVEQEKNSKMDQS